MTTHMTLVSQARVFVCLKMQDAWSGGFRFYLPYGKVVFNSSATDRGTHNMRAKAWLFANGHIKADGRGRMPTVSMKTGESVVTLLSDSGQKFSDWPKGQVVKAEDTGEVSVKRDASPQTTVAEIPEFRFTEDEFTAIETRNGKKVHRSLREACRHCRVSLVVCYCPTPMIVSHDGRGSVAVTIVRK